jgi:hypothetical protein
MDEFTSKKLVKDVDQIKRSLASVDKTLALQHLSLVEHMKRTELLEKKLEPVEEHVQQVRGITKFIGWMLGLLAVIAAFLALR